MDAITFALSYALIWLISRLPMRMIYACSDCLYLVVYYLARYRRKVVFNNLTRAFPEKGPAEITRLAKKFYRFFCDVGLEIFVSQRWSYEKIGQFYRVKNPEIVDYQKTQHRNVMIIAGHHGNWEWTRTFTARCNIHIIAIYKPLSNKYFDRWVRRLREDENHTVIPMEQSLRTILDFENRKVPYLSYLVADQRPLPAQIHHWITFLNQDTPVYTGPERIARKTGPAVMFLKTRRVKRGLYDVELIPITDHPADTAENEITHTFFRMLEEMIREQPELYLWSHNRWKFSREDIQGR
jgi:KDO2-lipid IV(A) lauroyltransferase